VPSLAESGVRFPSSPGACVENFLFRPLWGLVHFPTFTHGLRHGLHSSDASRLRVGRAYFRFPL